MKEYKNNIEYELGDVLQYGNDIIEVQEIDECDYCVFKNTHCVENCLELHNCSVLNREDTKEIQFVKVGEIPQNLKDDNERKETRKVILEITEFLSKYKENILKEISKVDETFLDSFPKDFPNMEYNYEYHNAIDNIKANYNEIKYYLDAFGSGVRFINNMGENLK